jgi:periplasmic protein TonB
MKFNFTKSSLILTLSLLSFHSFGQASKPDLPDPPTQISGQEIIYDIPDTPAEFPGGRDSLKHFLSSNIKYPIDAFKKKIEGKCYIRFIVSDTGRVENIVVKKGVTDCPECDAESIRVVKSMPQWKPAQLNGKNVQSMFSLPVTFKL